MNIRRDLACVALASGLLLASGCADVTETTTDANKVAVARGALQGASGNDTRTGVVTFRVPFDTPLQPGEFACTGTILTVPEGDIMLTAKHCLQGRGGALGFPVLGAVSACGIRLDPDADLAVVRFARPVPGVPREKFLALDTGPVANGTQLEVVGFGGTDLAGNGLGIRRSANFRVIGTSSNEVSSTGLNTGPVLLLRSESASACPGDSGGPALRDFGVVGVASTSSGCRNNPGTATATYVSIEKRVNFLVGAIASLRSDIRCPPGVQLTPVAQTLKVGQSITITVTVPLSASDTFVQLTAEPANASVPATPLRIPAGQSTATFQFTAGGPARTVLTATVTSTLATATAVLTVPVLMSSTCSAELNAFCQAYGCFCEDGGCTGGACAIAPGACTNDLLIGCAAFGCACTRGNCTDGNCNPAPPPPIFSSSCTAEQINNCKTMDCLCEFGVCTGGSCDVAPGACTDAQIEECAARNCGCTRGTCTDGECPAPMPQPPPPAPRPPPPTLDPNKTVTVIVPALFSSSCSPENQDYCADFGCFCESNLIEDVCTGGRCRQMELGCSDPQWSSCLGQGCGCTGFAGGCADGVCTDSNTLFGNLIGSLGADPFCVPLLCNSPIIIDVDADGFDLTSPDDGVVFDIRADGTPLRLGWTTQGDDDAWLALDRNANGRIDDGSELFGNYSRQPYSDEPNGYRALAVLDLPGQGGNGNGFIDAEDAVFDELRLWRDSNHDGNSDPPELTPLQAAQVEALGLDYRESRRKDRHGNGFRYRARVYRYAGGRAGWLSYDVFLQAEESSTATP